MTKYTEKQIIRACELRETGLTYGQIGRLVQMHPASVLEYCQAGGAVSPRVHTVFSSPTFSVEDDALLLQLREDGHSAYAISKIVGRQHKNVANRLRSLAFNEAKVEARGEAA